jgi:hypothetical protein
MRSAVEIREYFIDSLNHALPRLGMYGGEMAAMHFLSAVAFIDEREAEFDEFKDSLKARGAFCESGVGGAFEKYTHLPATDNEIGSAYAEIAFRMGYLKTDRILDQNEFESLRSGLDEKCRSQDFTTEEVVAEYGVPSWASGTNPFYPWTYLYFCNEIDDGIIAFDFWNVVYVDWNTGKVKGEFGDLPVLRNVRIRGADFGKEFTFTPFGRKITKRG